MFRRNISELTEYYCKFSERTILFLVIIYNKFYSSKDFKTGQLSKKYKKKKKVRK